LIGDKDARWIFGPTQEGIWATAVELDVPVAFQMRPDHAPVLADLVTRHPELIIIADYLGAAVFHEREYWGELGRLAQHPNLYIKLLSVAQDSRQPYPFRDLWPFYEFLVSTFEPLRIMFGTDYPHVLTRCSYEQATSWLNTLPFLDDHARHTIGEGTARNLWQLNRN
jgi:predicted TIM-barrel fold metal-dependent hydrolase